jgi:hypothetical protein
LLFSSSFSFSDLVLWRVPLMPFHALDLLWFASIFLVLMHGMAGVRWRAVHAAVGTLFTVGVAEVVWNMFYLMFRNADVQQAELVLRNPLFLLFGIVALYYFAFGTYRFFSWDYFLGLVVLCGFYNTMWNAYNGFTVSVDVLAPARAAFTDPAVNLIEVCYWSMPFVVAAAYFFWARAKSSSRANA